jgi:hypothetical protein
MKPQIKRVPLRFIKYNFISVIKKGDMLYHMNHRGEFDEGKKNIIDWGKLSDDLYEDGYGVFNVRYIDTLIDMDIYQVVQDDKIVVRDLNDFVYELAELGDGFRSCVLRILSLVYGLDHMIEINIINEKPKRVNFKSKHDINKLRDNLQDPGEFFKIT